MMTEAEIADLRRRADRAMQVLQQQLIAQMQPSEAVCQWFDDRIAEATPLHPDWHPSHREIL